MQARARWSDPATSHEAARLIERNGKAAHNRRLLLTAARAHPERTAGELARHTGLDRHEASRRLPELRDAGFLLSGKPRICEVLGTKAMVWWPADEPEYKQEELC